jgi:hypothetical protein
MQPNHFVNFDAQTFSFLNLNFFVLILVFHRVHKIIKFDDMESCKRMLIFFPIKYYY